jgi:hypothetical protein
VGRKQLVTPEALLGNALVKKDWATTLGKEASKPANVVIRAELTLKGGKLAAKVNLEKARVELPATAVVRPVLFRREAETKVTAGENKGKTLKEYFIVLSAHAPLSAAKAQKKGVEAKLVLPKGVAPEKLGLAVLVEDPKTMTTHEATVFDLPVKKEKPPKGK